MSVEIPAKKALKSGPSVSGGAASWVDDISSEPTPVGSRLHDPERQVAG